MEREAMSGFAEEKRESTCGFAEGKRESACGFAEGKRESGREKIRELLEDFLQPGFLSAVASGSVSADKMKKLKLRPVLAGGRVRYQAEKWIGNQVFHENMDREAMISFLEELMGPVFRQLQLESEEKSGSLLVSKKGKATIHVRKKTTPSKAGGKAGADLSGEALRQAWQQGISHNRKKNYILEEGIPVPFLVELGVQTADGQVVHAKYDKFRQINRFLEFIEDVLPKLDRDRESVILDFGCGKSYLTFAMYYYLKELKGYPVRIIGLDLKADVIRRCSELAVRCGYDALSFSTGDIASYEGVERVDMVVTLHACDTATDYALEKAVRWGAKVILSVPCCQHELNRQMESGLFAPVFGYGIIKERMAALYTDALRAQILEYMGYRVQILEFIDMEHTPKNLLIRAVRQGKKKENREEIEEVMEALHVKPTLYRLLMEEDHKD